MSQADNAANTASSEDSEYKAAKAQFDAINDVGKGLVSNVDGRLLWLELLSAINQCLPAEPKDQPRPDDISKRNEIHVTSLQCEWFPDLGTWYNGGIAEKIKEAQSAAAPPVGADAGAAQPPADGVAAAPPPGAPEAAAGAAVPAADGAAAVPPGGSVPAVPENPPTGEGWVIQLVGHHYHNEGLSMTTAGFVRETFIKNLRDKKITLLDKDGKASELPIKELGISAPVITSPIGRWLPYPIPDPNDEKKTLTLKRWDFTIQFAWQPTPLGKRLEKRQQKETGQPNPALAAQGGAP
jgi:type IV pilus assembly protein PilM